MAAIQEIFNAAFWYMAPILVALSTTVTGLVNQWFKIPDKFKQLASWIVGAVLSCGAIFFGFLGESIGWPSYIALSIVVGLSSNGIYDIEAIKKIIDSWFNKKK